MGMGREEGSQVELVVCVGSSRLGLIKILKILILRFLWRIYNDFMVVLSSVQA